ILNELDQRIDRARPSQKVRRGPVVMRRWIAIAAGILLLLLAGIFLFQSPDSQQLAEQYFEPFPDALSAQTRGDEVVEYNLNSALRHYQDGAYDVAISYFETYVSIQNPDAVAPLLYQGVSHLALKQYAEALPLLEKVRSSTALRKEYRNAAQWYLAIAYLGLEQEEQARPLLIDLARRENFFQEKAGALMASM
ncbi:MAG: hypothetical protein KDC44_11730, partial [Phaeodactylibacter sp.]|nr:hypothetical protein [Phaeodactylibacter sp.]